MASEVDRQADEEASDAEQGEDDKFHEEWMAQSVRVVHGPHVGREGTVQGTYPPRVQVQRVKGEALWFYVKDLEIING